MRQHHLIGIDRDDRETARRVTLMHETARLADQTDLGATDIDRLRTLVDATARAVVDVQHRSPDLRATLLALNVHTQLWINQLDRDHAA